MNWRFEPVTEATLPELSALARETFSDTFVDLYSDDDLEDFLGKKCSVAYFADGLARGAEIMLVYDREALIGYYKIDRVSVPASAIPDGSIEIDKLYLRKDYRGRGLGGHLLEHVLSRPKITQASHVFLCVWEGNLRAKALYEKYRFRVVQHFPFMVGTKVDCDLILRRDQS